MNKKVLMKGRKPAGSVFVDHPSKWGNPFNYKDYPGTLEEQYKAAAIDFEESLTPSLRGQIKRELKGKDLCCRCPEGFYCHADVLLKVAASRGRSWKGHKNQVQLKVTFRPEIASMIKEKSKKLGQSYRELIEYALIDVFGDPTENGVDS